MSVFISLHTSKYIFTYLNVLFPLYTYTPVGNVFSMYSTARVMNGESVKDISVPTARAHRERGREGGREGGRERERENNQSTYTRHSFIGRTE